MNFTDALKCAIASKERSEIVSLINSIPPDNWIIAPWLGRARVDDTEILVGYVSGGSGINTYEKVSLLIVWSDESFAALGAYSADEIKLPTYVDLGSSSTTE